MAGNKRIPGLPQASNPNTGMLLAAYNPITDTTIALLVDGLIPSSVSNDYTWDYTHVYMIDDIAVFEDQLYISQQDDNLDNPPDAVGSTFWTLGVKSASGLVPWSAGIFTNTDTTVLYKLNGNWGLYYLDNATRPYNSSNFTAELAAKDWALVNGYGRVGVPVLDCGTYDATSNVMPVEGVTANGSGDNGDILDGNEFTFGVGGGTINGNFWPEGTIIRAKQDHPTLEAHYRFY